MRGNKRAVPPQPVISPREGRLIELLHLDGAFASISYEDAAGILNMVYRPDNEGRRSGSGVYKFLNRKRKVRLDNK